MRTLKADTTSSVTSSAMRTLPRNPGPFPSRYPGQSADTERSRRLSPRSGDRVRCAFWAAVDLAEYPNVQAWHDRIEQTPVILDALKIPSQDLVTRVKNDPELEARITAAMEKRKAEAKEKADGAGGSTAE